MNSLQFVIVVLAIAVIVVLAILGLFLMIANHVKGADVTDWEDETR